MGSVSLQWSLNQSSDSLVGISRGLLRAATSDNVQILALLACESYGTLVAMSPESSHKVFLLCDRSHESAPLVFLKASVGYSKGDSAYQLARSDAGQRFLGLAACLGSLRPWNAAIALHELINNTAKDKLLVPTKQHLKQLMQALEGRLARSGFCESVVGWSKIFVDEMVQGEDRLSELPANERDGVASPTVKAVTGLTTALSHLARVGEASRIRILTTAGRAAWFVAFVKWCLGAPPRIILHHGQVLGSETTSLVTLQLIKNSDSVQDTRIELYDYADELKQLVTAASSPGYVRGMVSVGGFGQAMMRQRFGTPDGLKYRACAQALPYACYLVRQNLKVESSTLRNHFTDVPPGCTAVFGNVFPTMDVINRKIHEYQQISLAQTVDIPTVPPEFRLEDLPLLSMVESRIREVCACNRCLCDDSGRVRSRPKESCPFLAYLSDVSRCVAEVMALSLLNPFDPNGVLVYFGCDTSDDFSDDLLRYVREVLEYAPLKDGSNSKTQVSISDIIQYVTQLLGHENLERSTWVMSSYHDQTIYPRRLSTQTVQQDSILLLDCIPGYITWGTERYSVVHGSGIVPEYMPGKGPQDQRITGNGLPLLPCDKFPDYKVVWEVTVKEDGVCVELSIPKFATSPRRNPRDFLIAAVDSIYVSCIHDPNSSFTPNDCDIREVSPLDPGFRIRDPLLVVQCANNEPVRFFCLASGRPGIVRMTSCLECCIRFGLQAKEITLLDSLSGIVAYTSIYLYMKCIIE